MAEHWKQGMFAIHPAPTFWVNELSSRPSFAIHQWSFKQRFWKIGRLVTVYAFLFLKSAVAFWSAPYSAVSHSNSYVNVKARRNKTLLTLPSLRNCSLKHQSLLFTMIARSRITRNATAGSEEAVLPSHSRYNLLHKRKSCGFRNSFNCFPVYLTHTVGSYGNFKLRWVENKKNMTRGLCNVKKNHKMWPHQSNFAVLVCRILSLCVNPPLFRVSLNMFLRNVGIYQSARRHNPEEQHRSAIIDTLNPCWHQIIYCCRI
jgi:hypothetical protein